MVKLITLEQSLKRNAMFRTASKVLITHWLGPRMSPYGLWHDWYHKRVNTLGSKVVHPRTRLPWRSNVGQSITSLVAKTRPRCQVQRTPEHYGCSMMVMKKTSKKEKVCSYSTVSSLLDGSKRFTLRPRHIDSYIDSTS